MLDVHVAMVDCASNENHSNLSTPDHIWAQAVAEEKATRDPNTAPSKKEWPYFEVVGAVLLKQKNSKTLDTQNGNLAK